MRAILEYRVVQPGPGLERVHTLDGQIAGQVWAENVAATIRAGGSPAVVQCRVFGSGAQWRDVPG